MVILVNPIGDFPLNDDWAYGQTVKSLLDTGNFILSDWTATNLLSQALWGTLFCIPFGFSFTVLRFSTLTLGMIGVLATYGLLRSTYANSGMATVGAILIAVNPIYLGLSHTFMPDIPFFSLSIVACYFFILGWKHSSNRLLMVGLVVTYINLLGRQASFIFLLTFGLAHIIGNEKTLKTFLEGSSAIFIGFLVQFLYQISLSKILGKPALYGNQIHLLLENLLTQSPLRLIQLFTSNILIMLVYVGLFLLPFLIVFIRVFCTKSGKPQRNLLFLFLLSVIYVSLLGLFRLTGQEMPLIGNILTSTGIGPISISGYFLESSIGYWTLKFFRMSLTGLALLGLVLLCLTIFSVLNFSVKSDAERSHTSISIKIFLVASTILYPLSFSGLSTKFWFDRYLLVLVPLMMATLLFWVGPEDTNGDRLKGQKHVMASALSSLLILFYGVFSVASVHDYLMANKIHWQALDELMEVSQVLPSDIDGGFEFNGWYFGQKLEICNPDYKPSSPSSLVSWGDFSCLWGDDSKPYTTSFSAREGYQIAKQYDVNSWLPFNMKSLFLLKKST